MKSIQKTSHWPALLIMLLLVTGCAGLNSQSQANFQASGVIEATQINISPELAGRVAEVYVAESDAVKTGDPLFRLDGELLETQRDQASIALETAQANMAVAQSGVAMGRANYQAAQTGLEVMRAQSEADLAAAEKQRQDLFDNAVVARGQAQEAVAKANRAVRDAQYQLDNFTIPVSQEGLSAMEAITVTRKTLAQARQAFEPYKFESSGNPIRERLRDDLDQAQSDYDTAVRRLELDTALTQAQAGLDLAMQNLGKLKDGPDPDQLSILEARIAAIQAAPRQGESAITQAQTGQEQSEANLEAAQKTVAQAQANLDLINAQIAKLTVYAPVDGVVMARSVEPGEVLQPGMTALAIAQLGQLTVTVYIPEDRYGQVKLGDTATLQVDSYPGETFEAVVTRISDQAEYTPRNVQTKEERQTTVYAVVLTVDNPDGKLKPGMPADVNF